MDKKGRFALLLLFRPYFCVFTVNCILNQVIHDVGVEVKG
jgi:hypothetical protein